MLLDADGHLLFGGAHEGEEGKAKSGPLSVFSGDKLESLIKIAVVYKINEKKLQELGNRPSPLSVFANVHTKAPFP